MAPAGRKKAIEIAGRTDRRIGDDGLAARRFSRASPQTTEASAGLGIAPRPGRTQHRVLDYLHAHAVRPEFTFRNRWHVDMLGIWDNRCSMHYAMNDDPGQTRVMHRMVVLELEKPSKASAGAGAAAVAEKTAAARPDNP